MSEHETEVWKREQMEHKSYALKMWFLCVQKGWDLSLWKKIWEFRVLAKLVKTQSMISWQKISTRKVMKFWHVVDRCRIRCQDIKNVDCNVQTS